MVAPRGFWNPGKRIWIIISSWFNGTLAPPGSLTPPGTPAAAYADMHAATCDQVRAEFILMMNPIPNTSATVDSMAATLGPAFEEIAAWAHIRASQCAETLGEE